MTTLSQYYQDLLPPDAPTFHKRTWPQPPEGLKGDELYKQYAPHVITSHPMADVIAKYTAEATTACIVDLTFTKAQQERLLVLASSPSKHQSKSQEKQRQSISSELTQQDAFSAYLISLQRRCYNSSVQSVMYMMNVSDSRYHYHCSLVRRTRLTLRIPSTELETRTRILFGGTRRMQATVSTSLPSAFLHRTPSQSSRAQFVKVSRTHERPSFSRCISC